MAPQVPNKQDGDVIAFLDAARAKKAARKFEALVMPFVRGWDEHSEQLEPGYLAEFMKPEDMRVFVLLQGVQECRTATQWVPQGTANKDFWGSLRAPGIQTWSD